MRRCRSRGRIPIERAARGRRRFQAPNVAVVIRNRPIGGTAAARRGAQDSHPRPCIRLRIIRRDSSPSGGIAIEIGSNHPWIPRVPDDVQGIIEEPPGSTESNRPLSRSMQRDRQSRSVRSRQEDHTASCAWRLPPPIGRTGKSRRAYGFDHCDGRDVSGADPDRTVNTCRMQSWGRSTETANHIS